MNYYKIYSGETFIGIATSSNFLTYQEQNNLLLTTNETMGQFVEYKGKLYRDSWMSPLPSHEYNFEIAHITEISEEEYNILEQSIEKNEVIIIEIPQEEIPNQENSLINVTLEFVLNSKINEMSYECRKAIYAGFDVEWEDHTTSHFSMTEQDQLNLMELSTMIASGMPSLPYHADGEAAKFYTVEEAQKIINASTKHKMYHTSYFNCLKQYIQSLETIEEVAAITYGDTIPAEFETDVYKMVK